MNVQAQTTQLAAWDFQSNNTTAVLATGVAAANISAGGSLQKDNNLSNSFTVRNMTAVNLSQAQNGAGTVAAQYISISITPAANYAYDITNIAIRGYSQNRNRSFNLSYINPSNGTLVNVQTQSITTPTQARTYNITGLTNRTTPIEFRFYLHSATINGFEAAGFGEQSGLDVVINGKIYNTLTQEVPGTWSLQGNTIVGTQFIGSTNNQAVAIKANNNTGLTINTDGSVTAGDIYTFTLTAGNINTSHINTLALNATNITNSFTGLYSLNESLTNSVIGINSLKQSLTNSVTGLTTSIESLNSKFNTQNSTLNTGITFTGPKFDIYTPVQGQYNGGNPLLSLSQYGEIKFFSSPFLNYNGMYLKGTGDYSNGISYADSFGTATGIGGTAVFGQNGGVLGTKSNVNLATGKPALTWEANGNVNTHGLLTTKGGLKFSDGSVQTTSGSTWNVTNNYLTYSNDVNISGRLKIGTASLYATGITSVAGSNNAIYGDGGPLNINSNTGNFNNTIINANGGKVVIGAATVPTGIWPDPTLYVNGNIYTTGRIASKSGALSMGDERSLPGVPFPVIPNAIYLSSGNGSMRFLVNNIQSLVINSQGHVGIGSAASSIFKFNVEGDAVVQGKVAVQSISFPDGTSFSSAGAGGSFAGGWTVGVAKQNTYTALSGNVGIGTVNPTGKLHVKNGNITVENGNVYADNIQTGNNLYVYGNGIFDEKVGIGTDAPQTKLHVVGRTRTSDGYEISDQHHGIFVVNNELVLWNGAGRMFLNNSGNVRVSGTVAIGNVPARFADYKLAVDGRLYARQVTVPSTWADYVFDKDYKLEDLDSLSAFIKVNKHLPGIPTAKEVQINGLDTGEMIKLQMVKIEELTLHIIELNNRINKLSK